MSDTLSLKLLKVDNWGIFFLQRLQESFSKSNFCDLTLKFSGEAKLKVHRLVLNTCTEYFLGLEKQGNNEPNCLQLPNELHPDVVLPIINFMYTGRLEFKEELQDQLYTTAKEMKMTILTRLLDAQAVHVPPAPKLQSRKSQPPITYNLQGKKVIPKMVDPDLPETLPGRKLPIWKRRSAPPALPSVNEISQAEEFECSSREEPPRPTRFEWPEEEEGEELGSFSGAFDNISYDSKPLQRPKEPISTSQARTTTPAPQGSPVKATVSFEELRKTVIHKRPANQLPESPGAKKGKVVDIQEVKEYLQEQELRKNLVDTEEEGGNEDDDFDNSVPVADLDDEEEEDKEASPAEESLTVTENVSHVEVVEPIPSPSHPSDTGILAMESPIGHPQKSILKSRLPRDLPDTPPSKRVRFSLGAEPVEGEETNEKTIVKTEHNKEVPQVHSQTECSLSCSTPNPNNLSNHAKIISEVLKKYPHLVKDNKNIKLKIMQRGHSKPPVTQVDGDGGKVVRSKVSYVVVKSNDSNKGKVVLKRGALTEPLSEFVNPEGQKPPSGAENITGPWLCHSCGTNEEPINFETYYSYRKHLQDVHMEKIDARICEHCGHKASKRNLLLYHLYTRHGVPPPRNCQFPKCDQCDYVALSESLLIKHRNNHSNSKDFVCKVCNASFKSNGALQGHIQANLHGDPTKKKYECPYCRKPFVRNINLKAHIRSSHKEIARQLDGEEENLPEHKKKKTRPRILDSGSTVLHLQGTGSSEEGSHPEHTVLVLQSGDKVLTTSGVLQTPSLVPSSEAEALSNVASGIAASLGITDQVAELSENGSQVQRQENAGNSCSAFVIHDVSRSVQEYILPEIMGGDIEVTHAYSGQLADLEQYGGEETSSCALDGNSDQLTAVSTANGTAYVEIGKQIPGLLADPNAQLHGNDFSGQRLAFMKDGVAIGILVSQPSDTIGTTVLSRSVGETSTGVLVDLNATTPKLERELPNNGGDMPNEQASTVYDGVSPILMREVPPDATAPTGTSTVVLVTLPPTSQMGMQVAMRESDFEVAMKCYVLAQDGSSMSPAPQVTLMNAIPQEEASRENTEKSVGSTGKIGRIGILKKKNPDHSRMVRNIPTAVSVIPGALSPTKSSTVSQPQQIGFLLPLDSVQKATNSISQASQLSQVNSKLNVVMTTEAATNDTNVVQSSFESSQSGNKLLDQSHLQIKTESHVDAISNVPVGVQVPSQAIEGSECNSGALVGKKDNPIPQSSVSSEVLNSGQGGFEISSNQSNSREIEENIILRLENDEGVPRSHTVPMSNQEVTEPTVTVSSKQDESKLQKEKASVAVPNPNETVKCKVEVEEEHILEQGNISKSETPSKENRPIQTSVLKDYNPETFFGENSQNQVSENDKVERPGKGASRNVEILHEKKSFEGKLMSEAKITQASEQHMDQLLGKSNTSASHNLIQDTVVIGNVTKSTESVVDGVISTDKRHKSSSENVKKDAAASGILQESYGCSADDSKIDEKSHIRMQKKIPSSDVIVGTSNLHSVVSPSPTQHKVLNVSVCQSDKTKPDICDKKEKVT